MIIHNFHNLYAFMHLIKLQIEKKNTHTHTHIKNKENLILFSNLSSLFIYKDR